jgi:hypothetical protein
MVKNNGSENLKKMAKTCRKKAAVLRNKIEGFDQNEVWQMVERIEELESMASDFDDQATYPRDVEAAQEEVNFPIIPFPKIPKQRETIEDMRLRLPLISSKGDESAAILMDELKRQARFWKDINSWEPNEILPYYFCGPEKPKGWIEAMCIRGWKNVRMIQTAPA